MKSSMNPHAFEHLRRLTWPALTAVALAISGCAVGPTFVRPEPPAAVRYTPEVIATQTVAVPTLGGGAQRLVSGMDVSAQWWTAFGSKPLDELVDAALRANPDLQAAEAALRAARENVLAQRAAFFPSADVHLTPTRQSIANNLASPASSGNSIYNLHTAQLNISYSPDVFGGNRRQVESLEAQTEVQRFQREATFLSLTSNVVVAAIQEASLRAQIAATRELIAAASRQLDMVRKQRALGQSTAADVAAQEVIVAQAQATLPPLSKQLAQQRDLLAVLAGRLPSDELAQRFELDSIRLPEELPLSLPSRLVEQRPDIRAAEALLHAANAQVGVAAAARLPNFMLSASAGSAALTLANLFKAGGGFWSLGLDVAQPLFNAGALRHKELAAQALRDQSAAQYRSTVLTAFQNVADTLQAIQFDAQTLSSALGAEQAASKSVNIARRQWELGALGYPAVLAAQQAHQQTVIALVQAQAARFADTTALFQALGGGWWNRPDASADLIALPR